MVLQATWMQWGAVCPSDAVDAIAVSCGMSVACLVQVKLEAVTTRVSVAEGGWAEAGGRPARCRYSTVLEHLGCGLVVSPRLVPA